MDEVVCLVVIVLCEQVCVQWFVCFGQVMFIVFGVEVVIAFMASCS